MKGFSKEGKALRHHYAKNTGHEIGGLDCTLIAPKSVSLLAVAQGNTEVWTAHQLAVQSTLKVTENRFTQTRLRTENSRILVNTQNMAIAVFWHDTSREIDPHLHSHCLMMNCTYVTEKDAWYSLDNRAIHEHKKWLGQLYQHELARHIQELGYEIKTKNNGQFEVQGFTEKQLLHFFKND